MKMLRWVSVVLAFVAMSACAAENDAYSEADLRSEMETLGFPQKLTDCIVTEVKETSGGLDGFFELSESQQADRAAKAGANCALDNPDEMASAVEGNDMKVTEQMRESMITGMETGGASRELAECVVDAAIDQEIVVSDFSDVTKMQALMDKCEA